PVSDLTFPTSNETVTALRFNLAESSILATKCTDRTLTLYDIRTGKAERRLVMQMRANALSWSPTFPTALLVASEDHNLCTFDVRSLSNPTQVYKSHVAAVMSRGWSPTGQEFVSGGWDRTVMIWKEGDGPSRWCTPGSACKGYSQRHTPKTHGSCCPARTMGTSVYGKHAHRKSWAWWKVESVRRKSTGIDYERGGGWTSRSGGSSGTQQNVPVAVKKAGQLKRTMVDARAVKEERRRKHTR
ncbi:unnamed protein product, partial [Rhizoctonia solani]